ncbi:MAG: hypothetical protein CML47_05490 [Rhodobacteraceae bacterium]|nr:MAG: hypothetical protein CML47_05490 [Paracoccaceae bacterium]
MVLASLDKAIPLQILVKAFCFLKWAFCWRNLHSVGLSYLVGDNQWFAMVIMEGRTREVRRLWESQDLQVSRLKRVRYGDLFLPANLRQGSYKELSKSEVKVIEHL